MYDFIEDLEKGAEVPAVDALQELVLHTIELLDMWSGSWQGKRSFTACDKDDIQHVEFLGALSAHCFNQFNKQFGRFAKDGDGESC